MEPCLPSMLAEIEIGRPRRLTGGALLAVHAFGLLLLVPVLACTLAVTVMQFSALTFLLPAAVLAITTFFLPIGFGNPAIGRLLRQEPVQDEACKRTFLVQLTVVPRLHSGLRAVWEDADDFGWLIITDSALEYHGDAVKLRVPFGKVQEVSSTASAREFYLYGARTNVAVSGLPNITALVFAERSSWVLPTARKTARELSRELSDAAQAQGSPRNSAGR